MVNIRKSLVKIGKSLVKGTAERFTTDVAKAVGAT
jgi:hypothetical protein